MRELSKTEAREVSGGADPLTSGLVILFSPFGALILQQQSKAAGLPVPSYFKALAMYIDNALSN